MSERGDAVRDAAATIRSWYPETTFIPPTTEQLERVRDKIGADSLCALSAHLMRHACDVMEQIAAGLEDDPMEGIE